LRAAAVEVGARCSWLDRGVPAGWVCIPMPRLASERPRANDFRRCEHAYTAALGYYLEAGYRLFVLGDAEELWEERAETVIKRYDGVLDLEAEFVRRGNGLERFFGNHDDQWASNEEVAKHLSGVLGNIAVREGLRLQVERPGKRPGTLFFVHGHQGTADSDRWRPVSRLFVRHVWRPIQRRTGFSATRPSRNYALRAKHDRAMYEWARGQTAGLVLIAGHTHRPVFARSTPEPPPTSRSPSSRTHSGGPSPTATRRRPPQSAPSSSTRERATADPTRPSKSRRPATSTPAAARSQTATSPVSSSPTERSGSSAGPATCTRYAGRARESRPRSASWPRSSSNGS
jgi:hypothetical protein